MYSREKQSGAMGRANRSVLAGGLALLVMVLQRQLVGGQVFYYQPEQVHLAFGESTSEIVVTWSTMTATNESVVEYGIGGYALRFVIKGRTYSHRTVMNQLRVIEKLSVHYGKYLMSRLLAFQLMFVFWFMPIQIFAHSAKRVLIA